MDYRSAGVDVERGYEAVRRIRKHAKSTLSPQALSGLGGFGGLYSLEGITPESPVLVSGTDGVGTKLKLAFTLDKHDTIGIDCVAMCANDVVCQGAKPLFFLDYLATGRIVPETVEAIVAGVAEGCRQAGCSLIGGETAEMPGFYPEGEYDLAGFCVGLADRKALVTGSEVKEGHCLVGLASSGVHSNGFSLVRKLAPDTREGLDQFEAKLGRTWGEELLTPTRIYVQAVLAALQTVQVHGIAHITGGGFIENIPRMLPEGLGACVELGSWPILPIFEVLQALGSIEAQAMYNTFNMGIGLVMAVPEKEAQVLVDKMNELGEKAYIIGHVEASDSGVRFQ